MTENQQGIPSRRCPRCGGLMTKPAGSSLYWHADNNHPHCDITNIADASFAIEAEVSNLDAQSSTSKENNSKQEA